jgi:hypothetical protein
VTGAAQPAITSLGTLTSLTVSGSVTAGSFSGAGTGLTGTATGLTAGNAILASKASTLANGGGGTGMTFNWSGQGGQPTWLWGGNDGVNMYVWNPSNFNVNYANSAGSTGILTGPAHVNGSDGWFRSSGAAGWYNETYATGIWSTGGGLVQTYNNSSFQVNGTLYATQNVIAYYSDERLKTRVGKIENALDKVCSLEGFLYVENDLAQNLGFKNPKQQVALSAQQVQQVQPQAVTLAPFDTGRNEDGTIYSLSGEDYLTVDYERLVPLLVEAIKELRAEIKQLKGH